MAAHLVVVRVHVADPHALQLAHAPLRVRAPKAAGGGAGGGGVTRAALSKGMHGARGAEVWGTAGGRGVRVYAAGTHHGAHHGSVHHTHMPQHQK